MTLEILLQKIQHMEDVIVMRLLNDIDDFRFAYDVSVCDGPHELRGLIEVKFGGVLDKDWRVFLSGCFDLLDWTSIWHRTRPQRHTPR